jgi:hypothetical protein
LALSVCSFTHVPPHAVRLAWQVSAHVPAEQTSPAGHACPHAPQLDVSVCVLEHTPLQFDRPAWHES